MAGSKIECMICTVIGGGAFTGIGAYALWSSRPRAVGGPFGKGAVGLMGCVFLLFGVNRFLLLHDLRRISNFA